MKAGNVNGQDIKQEVWCDKSARTGARNGSFTTSIENVSPQRCQNQNCNDPEAELKTGKKR